MRHLLLLLVGALSLSAAPLPLEQRLTEKERAQGYRDRVILAKPRADRRARVDAEEARDGVRLRRRFSRFDDLRVIEVEPGQTVEAAIARLQATGRYEFVERDHLMRSDVTPNDPSFSTQWSFNNTGQLTSSIPGSDIAAPSAWDLTNSAPNVIVAIIDSGVRVDHPDLVGNLWVNPSPTFGDVHGARFENGEPSSDIRDETGHGTRIAGIIGAVGNNGIGLAGIAWRVQLMILKKDDAEGNGSVSDIVACMDYAVAHGAHIVNCSFGNTSYSQSFLIAIAEARAAGVIVVCSAGNDASNNDQTPHYPSSYLLDNVIAVGNSGPGDARSNSSNYGSSVELFAPGSSIQSFDFTSTLTVNAASGTSFAAPHVVGALALLKARFPTDTYRQLINRLLRGADAKTTLSGRALTNGRLNLFRALTTSTNRPFNDDFTSRPVIAGSTIALRASVDDATVEAGEPSHAGVATNGTLWWSYVASSTGTVTVDTDGSSYDTVLGVYTGNALTLLNPVAANDDGGTRGTSRVTFSVTSGTAYHVAVGRKAGTSGLTVVNFGSPPSNDTFALATPLTGESTQASARNNSATAQTGEPAILGNAPQATVWFRWTAPRTGRFQVSAFTRNFDTLLAIYTGSALGSLSLVAANDDTGIDPFRNSDSRCTLQATGGTTYYMQVDAKSAARGEVFLSITDSLWQFTTDSNDIYVAPSIGLDGTIYIGTVSPDRRVYAVGPDGSFKWAYRASGSLVSGGPAIGSNGNLYFGTSDGMAIALSPQGEVVWQRSLGSGNCSHTPALAADGTLYFRSEDGHLYALNPADGTTRWRYQLNSENSLSSTIVAPDGTLYQASEDKNLYALTPDGLLKWKTPVGGVVHGTPALDASGNIYLCVMDTSALMSITPAGIVRWTYRGVTIAEGNVSSPALSANGGTVYFGAADKKLHAINTANGGLLWTYTAADYLWTSSPAIDSNGVIYVGAFDGKLYAVNPNGSLKRTWDTGQPIWGSPVIFGTTLYVNSTDAKLYAFDIGAYAGGGPWPQYRHNVRSVGRVLNDPPGVTATPISRDVFAGASATFSVNAVGQGALAYQWTRNGAALSGQTAASLTVAGVQPAATGIYTVGITNQAGTTSQSAILGFTSTTKLVGAGTEFPDIFHPGTGFTYDQILLESGAAAFKADPGQILRISFIDLSNDIVQVEFSGAGTLSLVLDGVSGPAAPVNYNQAVTYMKGHAGIVLSGADATTNLSVFSVGRATAANAALFKDSVTYDGFADLAFIAITSTDGRFGGLRTANASYFGTKGLTGLYAPGVEFTGPVFIGDIRAADDATPVIVVGAGSDTRITGGDLLQANGRAVQISGLTQLRFSAGSNSHGTLFNAQPNQGRLEQNGTDVTTAVVLNP